LRARKSVAPRGTPLYDAIIDVLITLSDERARLVGPGDHLGAPAREGFGERLSDAGGAARHDRDLACVRAHGGETT
jgi:hypothetical protein